MSTHKHKYLCNMLVGVRWDSSRGLIDFSQYVDACLQSVGSGSYDWTNAISRSKHEVPVGRSIEVVCLWSSGRSVVACYDFPMHDDPRLIGWHFGTDDQTPTFLPVWPKGLTAHFQIAGQFTIDYTDSDVIKALTARYCITSSDAAAMRDSEAVRGVTHGNFCSCKSCISIRRDAYKRMETC